MPWLIPHAMPYPNIAVPVVSSPGQSFGLPRSTFQKPSDLWIDLSLAAIATNTRLYSLTRESVEGSAFITLARAMNAQPLPRDQNVVVLTYLLSRHQRLFVSLYRP